MTTPDREQPCTCGYDLRGLPPDGRCPECGRPVADADGVTSVVVRRWRRRVRRGGILLVASWTLWTSWLLNGVGLDDWRGLVLDGTLDFPQLNHPWTWFLGIAGRHGLRWTYVGRGLVCLGLVLMAAVPRPLRTTGLRWAGGLLRLVAVAVLVGTFTPLVLSWLSSVPSVYRLLDEHQDQTYRTLEAGDRVLQYTDQAICVSVGPFMAVVATAGGRRGTGIRAARLLFAWACVSSTFVDAVDPDRHFQRYASLRIADAVLALEGYGLVARFGWLSFWSPDRWRGGVLRRPTVGA